MPNEDLLQIESAMAELLTDAEEMAVDRRRDYRSAMRTADREWRAADRRQRETAAAIEQGIATDEMMQEHILEGARKRRMRKLFLDRQESHAIAELPDASLPPDRISINDSRERIE